MRPRFIGFGVLGLVMFLLPAGAPSDLSPYVLSAAYAIEAAIPRPIQGRTVELPAPPAPEPLGIGQPIPPPQGLPEDQRPGPVVEVQPVAPKTAPGWDGRRINILGIDRTQFPELMVIFELRDELGGPVRKINPNLMELTEDEAPQEIIGIGRANPERFSGDPLNIALLLDASGSMAKYMDVAQNAAARFVNRLREGDQAAVISFCNQPIVHTPLTTNRKRIEKGIFEASPRGFTALYDSAFAGINSLRGSVGRKAVVLLTDGKDDDGTGVQLSQRSVTEVVEAANNAETPIFVIGLGNDISRESLERLSYETGGDFLYAPSGSDLDMLYEQIASLLGRSLEGFYKLTYRATEAEKDGSNRTIILRHFDAVAVATYPAPRRYFWPLSKVF